MTKFDGLFSPATAPSNQQPQPVDSGKFAGLFADQPKTEPVDKGGLQIPVLSEVLMKPQVAGVKKDLFPSLDLRTGGSTTQATNDEIYKYAGTGEPGAFTKLVDFVNDKLKNGTSIFGIDTAYAPESEQDLARLQTEWDNSPLGQYTRIDKNRTGHLVSAITGNIITPGTTAPENVTEKVLNGMYSAMGTVAALQAIGGGINKLTRSSAAVTSFLEAHPLVSKYVYPFVKNAAEFGIYGQLDPKVTDRLKKFGEDVLTSIPYTATGMIPNVYVSIPASFGTGYTMAKIGGATDEDAIISGSILAALDGAGRLADTGGIVTGRASDRALKNEAINALNEYSSIKVNAKSTAEELKRAYRSAAQKTHPDVAGGSDSAFNRVNFSYRFLSGEASGTAIPKAQPQKPTEMKQLPENVGEVPTTKVPAKQEAINLGSETESAARARITEAKAAEKKALEKTQALAKAETGKPITVTGYSGMTAGSTDSGFRSLDQDTAQAYATDRGGAVQKFENTLEKPFVAEDQTDLLKQLIAKGDNKAQQILDDYTAVVGKNGGTENTDPIVRDIDAHIKTELQKLGFDSVVYKGTNEYQLFSTAAKDAKYTASSKKVSDIFNQSREQKSVGKIADVNFELGSFGVNHDARKAAEDKHDRFPASELAKTIANIKAVYKASDDPTNYRSDNLAWVAKMPDGELRSIYTRRNKNGAEEVLGWHIIKAVNAQKYIDTLSAYGAPAQTRTGTTSLERKRAIQLLNEGTKSVAENKASAKRLNEDVQIEKHTKEMRATYAKKPNADDELAGIKMELEISEPGERIAIDTTEWYGSNEGLKFMRSPSTFPDWLPEELRSTDLFNKVMGGMEQIAKLKFPEGNRTRQRELYNYILKKLDERLGVDTSKNRRAIIELYGSKQKGAGVDNRGAEGGKGGKPVAKPLKREPVTAYKKGDVVTDDTGRTLIVTVGNDVNDAINPNIIRAKVAGEKNDFIWYSNRIEGAKTQKEQVAKAVKEKPKSIREVASDTGILEPNVRRILGVGAKDGTFERVAEGVYVLKDAAGNENAYIEIADAKDALARMAIEGKKFQSVILDPAYFSRALIGGNRGIKQWEFITPPDFAEVMKSIGSLVDNDKTHVYLMLSGARTAQQDMQKYVQGAIDAGFKAVGEGQYLKTDKSGKPVTNVRGVEAAPERLILLTKSGEARIGEIPTQLDFRFIRPSVLKSYQTEKPAELMKALIEQSTIGGERVLDPFAGSGVTGEQALQTGRAATLIENGKTLTAEGDAILKKMKTDGNLSKPQSSGIRADAIATVLGKPTSGDFPDLVKQLVPHVTDVVARYTKPRVEKAAQEISEKAAKERDAQYQAVSEIPKFISDLPENSKFITNEQAKAVIDKYFNNGELDVQFVDRITTPAGLEAFGKYSNKLIQFVNNPNSTTPHHEAVHAYLDLFIQKGEKALLLADVKAKYPNEKLNDHSAEERLADDFVSYVRGRKEPKSRLRAFFDRVIAALKKLAKLSRIDRLYEDIISKARPINEIPREKLSTLSTTERDNLRFEHYQNPELLTGKIFKSPLLQGREELPVQFLRDSIKSGKSNIKPAEQALLNEVLDNEFKDQKKISKTEFERKVQDYLLPFQIEATDKWADYGVDRIFGDQNVAQKTYLIRTGYVHGTSNHFSSDDLFAHFRIAYDDKTAHVLEVQSDPFQKLEDDQISAPIEKQIENQKLEVSRAEGLVTGSKENLRIQKKNAKKVTDLAVKIAHNAKAYDKAWAEDPHKGSKLINGLLAEVGVMQAGAFFWGDDNKPLKAKQVALNLTNDAGYRKILPKYQSDYKSALSEVHDNILETEKLLDENNRKLSEQKTILDGLIKAKEAGTETPEQKRARQFLKYRNTWHEMALRLAIRTAATEGAQRILFPTAFTAMRVEDWDSQSGENNGAGEYEESDIYPGNQLRIYGEPYAIVSTNSDNSFTAVAGEADGDFSEDDLRSDREQQMHDEPDTYGLEERVKEDILSDLPSWKASQDVRIDAQIKNAKERVATREVDIKEKEAKLATVNEGKLAALSMRGVVEDLRGYMHSTGFAHYLDFNPLSSIPNNDEIETARKNKLAFEQELKNSGIPFDHKLEGADGARVLGVSRDYTVRVKQDDYADKELYVTNEVSKGNAVRTIKNSLDWARDDIAIELNRIDTLQAEKKKINALTEEEITDLDIQDKVFEDKLQDLIDAELDGFDYEDDLLGSYGSVYKYDDRGTNRYIVFSEKTIEQQFDPPSDRTSAQGVEDYRFEFERDTNLQAADKQYFPSMGEDYQGIAYRYEVTFPRYLEKYRGKDAVKRIEEPNGYPWFEVNLNPEDKGSVEAFQTKKSVEKKALEKIGDRVVNDNTEEGKSSFLNFAQKFRTEAVDNVYPLEVLAEKAGKQMTKEDPSLFARLFNNVSAIVVNNFNTDRGFWGWTGAGFEKLHDFNWKTLIKSLGKDTADFGNFLVARRARADFQRLDELETTAAQFDPALEPEEHAQAQEELTKLKELVESDNFDRSVVNEAYDENAKRFEEATKMYDTLVGEDLKFLNRPEVGLVNEDQYRLLTSRTGYASFKRAFFDELTGVDTTSGVARVGGTKVSSMISRKGSDKQIINPLYNAIKNHGEAMRKGLRQMVYNKVVTYAEQFPELFREEKLKVLMLEGGGIMFPQEKDPNVVMARVNYIRKAFTVDPLIKRTLDEVLNYQNMHVFERLLRSANSLFTKGTTGLYPGFALSNYGVDQITAVAQTRNSYIPIYDPLKAVLDLVMKKDSIDHQYFQEYLVLGGERQTFVGWQDLTPSELFNAITKEKQGLMRVANALNAGMDLLALPSKWSEIATRATEYVKSRKAGKPQIVALEEAGRVTAPFHHVGRLGGGRLGQTFIKSIPFFNPTLQVLDQVARQMETPEGRARYGFTALAVIAALVGSFAYLYMNATEKQKQGYLDLQPDELAKYIYFPNPNGENLIRFRIPDQMATLGVLFNMGMADNMMNANYKVGDYVSAAFSFLPQQLDVSQPDKMLISWIPQFFKPAVQVLGNFKDFPRVMPLVSQYQMTKPSELRKTESTSPLAAYLGDTNIAKKLDLSPIQIDYLLTGYLGRAVGFVTGKPGIYNPVKSLTRDYYFTSGRRLNSFYDVRGQNDQDYYALKHNLEKFTPQERNNILKTKQKIQPVEKLIDEYRKTEVKFPASKSLENLRSQILKRLDNLL